MAETSSVSNVWSFSVLQSGEVLSSFNNDKSANFSGEKKFSEEFRGVYFLTIRGKTLIKSNLVVLVVPDLKSKGLFI